MTKTFNKGDSSKISNNFKFSEFACKCNVNHSNKIATELVDALEKLRAVTGGKIVVNSGHRCISHNQAQGGGKTSKHIDGLAADVVCYDKLNNVISAKVICCIAQDLGIFGGIANINSKYQAVHLDMRTGSTWRGDEIKGNSFNIPNSNFYTYFGLTIDAVNKFKVKTPKATGTITIEIAGKTYKGTVCEV